MRASLEALEVQRLRDELWEWQKVARWLGVVLRRNGVGGYEYNRALEALDALDPAHASRSEQGATA